MNKVEYLDIISGQTKNLLNELMQYTLESRVRRNVDSIPQMCHIEDGIISQNERRRKEIREEGRQFMPWYVSKIVLNGVFNNPIQDGGVKGRLQMEESIKNCKNHLKLHYLLRTADNCVTTAIVMHDKKYTGAFSTRDLLEMAIGLYHEASMLKKCIKQTDNAGHKLDYVVSNLITYIPVIEDVFSLLKSKQESIQAKFDEINNVTLIKDEITGLISMNSMSVEDRKDVYLQLRSRYESELDLSKRPTMKNSLRELYLIIKADENSFKDDKLFPDLDAVSIKSLMPADLFLNE